MKKENYIETDFLKCVKMNPYEIKIGTIVKHERQITYDRFNMCMYSDYIYFNDEKIYIRDHKIFLNVFSTPTIKEERKYKIEKLNKKEQTKK